MIKTETYMVREDGVTLIKTYSDSGMMIKQNGTDAIYSEAIDPDFTGRTYTETDIPIEVPEEDEAAIETTAVQIVDVLLGEET